MADSVKTYLDDVKSHLHLPPETEHKVISELNSYFQDKVTELERGGVPSEQARTEAIASFGDARDIARLMYEANSRGSWVDALLACQPHLMAAALFATHLWHNPFLLTAALGSITLITILSWRGGSPIWMYSWAGYAFFPLLIFVFLCRHPFVATASYLFGGSGVAAPAWELAALGILCAVTVWAVIAAAAHVAAQDWLFASLMLLPLPVLGLWTLSVEHAGDSLFRLFAGATDLVARWDTVMAVFCLSIGITSALFVRLRQRALKAMAIILIGMIGGALVVRNLWADPGLTRLIAVSAGLFLVLTSPLLLQAFSGRGAEPKGHKPLTT